MLSDRLNQFIEYKGVTSSIFADTAGVPRPTLSQLLTGRSKSINDIMLSKLHYAFPELNIGWLLFGEGTMLVGDLQFSEQNPTSTIREASDFENSEAFSGISTANDEDPAPYGNPPRIYGSSAREIERIIVFYRDKTFDEFSPK